MSYYLHVRTTSFTMRPADLASLLTWVDANLAAVLSGCGMAIKAVEVEVGHYYSEDQPKDVGLHFTVAFVAAVVASEIQTRKIWNEARDVSRQVGGGMVAFSNLPEVQERFRDVKAAEEVALDAWRKANAEYHAWRIGVEKILEQTLVTGKRRPSAITGSPLPNRFESISVEIEGVHGGS